MNADEIARGLSPFQPETVSVQAGRLMLARLQELLAAGETFALETTLATRHYLAFISKAQAQGYTVHLFFFWLSTPEAAVQRVRIRVREGGHNIPEDVIRRRYALGLRYFFSLYKPVVNKWEFIDNSAGKPHRVAHGTINTTTVEDSVIWQSISSTYS